MIRDLKDVKKDDLLIAGGKGANLGEILRANINVPNGFIITTNTYKKFKDGSFPEDIQNLIKEKYRRLGENTRVAVRSSATAEDLPNASFAGLQETFLNVQGIENLLDRIKDCYASLWSDRAVSYRKDKGFDDNLVSIAVIIQEMIESEKAGILFTVNPLNQKENEMQINASYGLGESIVSGRVSADNYIVDKKGSILEKTIENKKVQTIFGEKETIEVPIDIDKRNQSTLNDKEILELVKCGLQIEKHYGIPMDIEWAIKDNTVYILQARAITTLEDYKENKNNKNLVENYLGNQKLNKHMKEIMAFLLEKIPFPHRALDFDYLMVINNQKRNITAEAGIVLPKGFEIDDDGIQTFSRDKKRINRNILNFFKVIKNMKDFEKCNKKCKEFMPIYENEIKNMKDLNFENMSLAQCETFIVNSHELLQKLTYDRFKYAMFPTFLSTKKFDKIIKQVNNSYSAFDFYWELNNKTSVVTKDISKIANEIIKNSEIKKDILAGEKFTTLYEKHNNFKCLTDNFMNKNGFKSDYNCYCLAAKTFIEDPDRLLNILKPIIQNNKEETSTEKDFSKLIGSIKEIYGNKFEKIEKQIEFFRYFHLVREESQYLWETLFYYIRSCIKRINTLLVGDDNYQVAVANLFYDELLETLRRGFLNEEDKEKIERRNQKFPLVANVWEASKLLVFETRGEILKGVSGSPGVAIGKVSLIKSPNEFYKMNKGDVLVCPFTDPEWTPLFKLASAVVADTGSALSHAAIIAREYNIPAVLGVGFATTEFKDGERIQVDGNEGVVKRC